MAHRTADYVYPVKRVRVVDGDTVDVDLDLGFRTTQKTYVRLVGVDTPEASTRVGQVVTEIVKKWFSMHDLDNLRAHIVSLDKYAGRTNGSIFSIMKPSRTLTKFLLDNDLGYPYDGGKRPVWSITDIESRYFTAKEFLTQM